MVGFSKFLSLCLSHYTLPYHQVNPSEADFLSFQPRLRLGKMVALAQHWFDAIDERRGRKRRKRSWASLGG